MSRRFFSAPPWLEFLWKNWPLRLIHALRGPWRSFLVLMFLERKHPLQVDKNGLGNKLCTFPYVDIYASHLLSDRKNFPKSYLLCLPRRCFSSRLKQSRNTSGSRWLKKPPKINRPSSKWQKIYKYCLFSSWVAGIWHLTWRAEELTKKTTAT